MEEPFRRGGHVTDHAGPIREKRCRAECVQQGAQVLRPALRGAPLCVEMRSIGDVPGESRETPDRVTIVEANAATPSHHEAFLLRPVSAYFHEHQVVGPQWSEEIVVDLAAQVAVMIGVRPVGERPADRTSTPIEDRLLAQESVVGCIRLLSLSRQDVGGRDLHRISQWVSFQDDRVGRSEFARQAWEHPRRTPLGVLTRLVRVTYTSAPRESPGPSHASDQVTSATHMRGRPACTVRVARGGSHPGRDYGGPEACIRGNTMFLSGR